jgi:putative hydrolase of the HAD superfamily
MVKAIFFDLDGTLADDGDSIKEALAEACQVVCARWPELDAAKLTVIYRQFSDTAWGDFDRYLRYLSSPEAMLAAVWNQTLASKGLHDPAVESTAAAVYWQYRLRQCRPYDDALPLLQQLAGRFHLSVLTNGAPAMQRAKLTATDLSSFFQQVFVGGEFARGKPDPLIFHAALKAAACQPHEAIHIGDSLAHDVAGARRVGINSAWLNRKGLDRKDLDGDGAVVPDFEVTTLTGLIECLKQLSNEL